MCVIFNGRKVVLTCMLLLWNYPAIATEPVTVLIYKERGPQAGAYISRLIVSDHFLRLDFGQEQEDFILYDRKAQQILSVTHDDRKVLVISYQQISQKSPMEMSLSKKRVTSAKINMPKPLDMLHYRYFANDARCSDSFLVPKLAPEAAKALQEYHAVLAGEHAQSMRLIPAEMLNACDLSINIFSPSRQYKDGFPIRELLFTGKERVLLDIDENHMMDEQWRQIPKEFKRYSPAQFHGEGSGV